MPRRGDYRSLLTCELSQVERDVLDEMKRLAGIGSDANLARIALWSLGDHLGLELPDGVFDLRLGSGAWARNPRVRQDAACPPLPLPAPIWRATPKRPAADHPWRGAEPRGER
jgi:hypothetical protein